MGVDIEMECEVTAINKNSHKISGLRTTKGEISTPLIINCAGAWAALVARMAGGEVRIRMTDGDATTGPEQAPPPGGARGPRACAHPAAC